MRSSQEQTYSEIQKELKYHVALLGTSHFHGLLEGTLFSSFLFIAKSKSHKPLSRLRVFLGNSLKTLAQAALGQLGPFFSRSGHGVMLQFSSVLRQHRWKRNLQQAYQNSREAKHLLAPAFLLVLWDSLSYSLFDQIILPTLFAW